MSGLHITLPDVTIKKVSGAPVCRCGQNQEIGSVTVNLAGIEVRVSIMSKEGVRWPVEVAPAPGIQAWLNPIIRKAWLTGTEKFWAKGDAK